MPLLADLDSQPQEAPLNEAGRRALQDLTRKYQNDKSLQEKLRHAAELMTEMTGKINDRAYERKQLRDKGLAKRAAKGEEEDEDERDEFEEFENRTADLNKQMDRSMRTLIDTRVWAEELPNNLRHVSETAVSNAVQATQRSTQHYQNEDDDSDADQTAPVSHEETPSALLHAALSTQSTRWNAKSLTDRYARDNDYASFYHALWDAQHPSENAPPLPAPALWFAREENPSTFSQRAPSQDTNGHNDEETELEIAAERVSLKCPITLQYYRDPVTSDICKHSFERTAILDMLKTSTDFLPFTATQQQELSQLSRYERPRAENQMRVKRVRCPECSKFMTESSLRPNPVLLRKVNREIEAERRRNEEASDSEEEDEDELQGPSGTQRKPFGLDGVDSSPPPPPGSARSSRKSVKAGRVKSERISVVPQTQVPSGTQRTTSEGATVVELDDDDEDELMT